MLKKLLNKIRRGCIKMRLRPIPVFVFHQVSELFDESVYAEPDWMAFAEFKEKIQDLRKAGYMFVSLQDANRHLESDLIRCKKYAVLTCDDGLKCQSALIPWLEEQKIPMTMFVSVKNLDGETCGEQILEIAFDNGRMLPYSQWPEATPDSKVHLSPFGWSGMLYSPHCFTNEVFNKDVYQKLCPKADDIWFTIMELIGDVPIVMVRNSHWTGKREVDHAN